MRCLVTGGAGYLGVVLVEALLDAGHTVRVVDRFSIGEGMLAHFAGAPGLELVHADVRRLDAATLRGHDAVIDLAGLASDAKCEPDPVAAEELNHVAAVRLAEQARLAGVARLVVASSAGVYGPTAEGASPHDERAPLRPLGVYASTKARADEAVRALATPSFGVTTLRCATMYGLSARMRFDLVVNRMTSNAVQEERIVVLGGGRQFRPLVHVRDVARAFLATLNAPSAQVSGEAFNVGGDAQTLRVAEIASLVASRVRGVRLEHAAGPADPKSYRITSAKIATRLGFRPALAIEQGIDEVRDALRNVPR